MPKRRTTETPALASYWMAPDRDGGVGEPIACFASTYTFHAAHFENELVPRFLGLRYDNTEREPVFVLEREDRLATVTAAVFVDASQVDGGQTTGRWLQVPVAVVRGCQHAKVTILVWERFIRVIVASANLTRSGYRKNREMASILEFFDADAAAPRDVLSDVLDFIDELMAFARMPPETAKHLAEALDATRRRARSWREMPSGTDRPPSVKFVPVLPPRERRKGRGSIDAIVEGWGNRRATDITVMTPFIGDSPEAVRTTLRALLQIPRSREAKGHLVIGAAPHEDRTVVDLPKWFRDEWMSAWSLHPSELSLFAVPPRRDGEPKAARSLHAKSILVESEDRTLLLMGSSNFSPHGLGEGAFNIEANLCFVARDRDQMLALECALPVDWAEDKVMDAEWPEDAKKPTEDGPSDAPSVPPAFAWVTYHDVSRKLSIGLNLAAPLPSQWWVRLPGSEVALLQGPPAPEGDRIEVVLQNEKGARRVTAVTIAWKDDRGAVLQATLPTLVADEGELLAPEELRALGSDGILDCLLSGRDPIEWADARGNRRTSQTTDPLDALKTIDTSSYTLYRTRRLGRALAALSRRLLSTLRTPAAIRHRLERDPVGPLMLADALVREAKASGGESSATAFGLAELSLCVAHVGARVDPKGKLKLLPLFRHCLDAVDALRGELSDAAAGGALGKYVRDVQAKSAALVPAVEGAT